MTDSTERFTQSGPFRALLAGFVVVKETTDSATLVLFHTECGTDVCEIEEEDSMNVLVQTVIEHDCEA